MVEKKRTDYVSFADGVEGKITESSIQNGMWKMKLSVSPDIIAELRETKRIKEGEVKEGESSLWVEVPEHLVVRAGHLISNPIYWGFCDFRGKFVESMPMASGVTHHDLIENLRRSKQGLQMSVADWQSKYRVAVSDMARHLKMQTEATKPVVDVAFRAVDRGYMAYQAKRKKK